MVVNSESFKKHTELGPNNWPCASQEESTWVVVTENYLRENGGPWEMTMKLHHQRSPPQNKLINMSS